MFNSKTKEAMLGWVSRRAERGYKKLKMNRLKKDTLENLTLEQLKALYVQKDGYVLVPLEPTDEMIEAGRLQGKLNELEFRLRDEGARLIYKAMLASNGKE